VHVSPQGDIAFTVVADARIDQDGVLGGAHHKSVNAEAHFAILGTEMRHQPVAVAGKVVVGDIEKEKARADSLDHFLDALHGDVANGDRLHRAPLAFLRLGVMFMGSILW
jgi:hypothetical protein